MQVVTIGNGAALQRRTSRNGSSANSSGGAISAPYRVRIVREGATFTGYHSPDGVNWTGQGSEAISMAEEVYIGLGGNAARTVTAWVYTRALNNGGVFEMGEQAGGRDFSLRTKSSDNQWRV